ncbi:MAG TPA: glycosyltransferase, partial [Actinomycetota bacterium]|nr:glycosyltransferase [Actinomycetota bacterium]
THSDGSVVIFWDVDAPATLGRMERSDSDPLRTLVPEFDAVFTYGGGDPVVDRYTALGARSCDPVYNALDPDTHFPVERDPDLVADLAFLGNRLPDREARVDRFFFDAARSVPDRRFLLGGAGWDPASLPGNVAYVGHVAPDRHNAFNCSPLAVLNVSRESMAANGYSPATRVFEAAGAGACLITDAWEGIELFLEPGREVLVAADGEEVAKHLATLDRESAQMIGEAARRRICREHTYGRRAEQVEALLDELLARRSR